jgi:hypothetical protein
MATGQYLVPPLHFRPRLPERSSCQNQLDFHPIGHIKVGHLEIYLDSLNLTPSQAAGLIIAMGEFWLFNSPTIQRLLSSPAYQGAVVSASLLQACSIATSVSVTTSSGTAGNLLQRNPSVAVAAPVILLKNAEDQPGTPFIRITRTLKCTLCQLPKRLTYQGAGNMRDVFETMRLSERFRIKSF